MNNATVCGHNWAKHNRKLKWFLASLKKYNPTLNHGKCSHGSINIGLLGYIMAKGIMKLGTKPQLKFPIPNTRAALRRTMVIFAHYSQ